MFLWVIYLRTALFHLPRSTLLDEEIRMKFAVGVSAFMEVSSKFENIRECFLLDKEIIFFFVQFWATDNGSHQVSGVAAEALCCYMFLEPNRNDEWCKVLDIVQNQFESVRDIAKLAISRARASLAICDGFTASANFGIICLLTRTRAKHMVRTTILEERVVPFLLRSISIILDTPHPIPQDYHETLVPCILALYSVFGWPVYGIADIPQGFRYGLLEIYFKFGKTYGTDKEVVPQYAADLLSQLVPAFTHLNDIFQAVRHDFADYSKKLGDRCFDIGSLESSYKNAWNGLEANILEHVILRRIRKLTAREGFVYCGNVSSNRILKLSMINVLRYQPECLQKEAQQTFMKCARCKHVFYCSDSCQKKSWKLYHCRVCKQIANANCMFICDFSQSSGINSLNSDV